MDDGGVDVGNDGGIVNQSHWALVVVRLGWKESRNVGPQPLNQPTGESTLKEAHIWRLVMSSLVNFADLMSLLTRVSGIRRKMLMNFSFFAGSTVNCLECMANNIPC